MKKGMLRCLFCFCLVALPGMIEAQEEKEADGRAARMEQMLEKRAEKMADDLDLKGDARSSFLETYKSFQNELMPHRTNFAFPRQENKKESEMTDEEAVARVKAEFDRKAQQIVDLYNSLEVEKKYYETFSKTLSAKQLMKIFAPQRESRGRFGGTSGRNQSGGRSGNFGGGFPQNGFGMDADW